jgi:hypothetical protein
MHLHPLAAAIACAPESADGLHPTEGFFDPLANPLANRITRMAYGAGRAPNHLAAPSSAPHAA